MNKLIDQIAATSVATSSELQEILGHPSTDYLFKKANQVRQVYCGNQVHIRGIIEFSNYCSCGCTYCGINCENAKIKRYRLSPNEIIKIAKDAYNANYKSIVLQSGEDIFYDADRISEIIRGIKKIGDMAITLSIGERPYEEYKTWKDEGADRFLLKHETSDEHLYNQLHPHSSFKKRLECLSMLKSLNYQTGSGFMIGLPGQKIDSLAEDILLLQKLEVAMAGIGLFIPHPETPLKASAPGDALLTLKCLALSRILIKKVHLPTTTSLEVRDFNNRYHAFATGANVIMKKVEPYKYRKLYEIYPNPNIKDTSIIEDRTALESSILSVGREISGSRGDAID